MGYLILLPLVTIATIINQTLSGVGRDPSPAVIFFTSLIPTFSISRGVIYLSQASRDDGIGIRLSQISSSGLGSVYGYLIGVAILYLLLTYYMEQVLPGNVGVAEHPCFCCFSVSLFLGREKEKMHFFEDKISKIYPYDEASCCINFKIESY